MTRRITLTPTWSGLLPAMLAMLEHGTPEAKEAAREQLFRMAQAADRHVAESRSIRKELE